MNKTGKTILGIALAGAAGAASVWLFKSKKGTALRHQMGDYARNVRQRTQDRRQARMELRHNHMEGVIE